MNWASKQNTAKYLNSRVCEIKQSCFITAAEVRRKAIFFCYDEASIFHSQRPGCLIIRKHHREDAAKAEIYLSQLFIEPCLGCIEIFFWDSLLPSNMTLRYFMAFLLKSFPFRHWHFISVIHTYISAFWPQQSQSSNLESFDEMWMRNWSCYWSFLLLTYNWICRMTEKWLKNHTGQ